MRRRLIWGAVTLTALAVVVNAGAAAVYLYDASRADVVARGVTIAGVDVGGLSARSAQIKLERLLVPRLERTLVLQYGRRHFAVNPRSGSFEVEIERMVEDAIAASRRGTILTRFVRDVRGGSVRAQIPLETAYSADWVTRLTRNVAAAINRPPHAARVVPHPRRITIDRSRPGVMLRRDAFRRELLRRLADPGATRSITIPTHPVRPAVTTAQLARRYPVYLLVSRENFQLRIFKRLKLYKTYPIAVGQAGLETPAGLYRINDKQVNPSWHVPNSPWAGDLAGRVIPPPASPLKARWMGFYNGAGIHGTDQIYSLGSAASHGCVRMAIPDVIELYDLVPMGTPIYIA